MNETVMAERTLAASVPGGQLIGVRSGSGRPLLVVSSLLKAAATIPRRLRSEASFAALCGVAPVPASSGRTDRHRLNRGGHRAANAALYTVVMVRMQRHEPTRKYVERRRAQGPSTPEIMRCLKRYDARELLPHILTALQPAHTPAIPPTVALYRTYAETHIIPALGKRKLRDLTVEDVEKLAVQEVCHPQHAIIEDPPLDTQQVGPARAGQGQHAEAIVTQLVTHPGAEGWL